MERYLLFDAGCAVCHRLAQAIEEEAAGKMEAVSIRDPRARAWLDQAYPAGWKHQPYLVMVEGERVQASRGLGMALRLGWLLGPGKAWRVWNLARRYGVVFPSGGGERSPKRPVSQLAKDVAQKSSRRQFMKLLGGSTLGALLGNFLLATQAVTEADSPLQDEWEVRTLTEAELEKVKAEALGSREVQLLWNLVQSRGLSPGSQVREGYQCIGAGLVIDGIRMLSGRDADGQVRAHILFDRVAHEANGTTTYVAVAVIQDVGAYYVQNHRIERVPRAYEVVLLEGFSRTQQSVQLQAEPATHECAECNGVCGAAFIWALACIGCLAAGGTVACFGPCGAYAAYSWLCIDCDARKCQPH